MQIKRVSSEEIKRNYTQITGREALERLLAGEEVFAGTSESWKIIDEVLVARDCDTSLTFDRADFAVNSFLDPEDVDWYVAPPFDARKEMLARPGEWVAKCQRFLSWAYIGFDRDEMVVVGSVEIGQSANHTDAELAIVADEIDRAIPLDDADLAKLAALKAIEKGVNANG